MRIALFGSSDSSQPVGDSITDIPAMREFCHRLGTVLAELPHALLVGTDNEKTADRMVVDGILSSGQAPKMRIWVYHQPARRPGQPYRGRVLLLVKDELELPSDISGVLYHSYRDSPDERAHAIADFIRGIRDR